MKRLLLLLPVILIIGCGLFGSEDYFPVKVGNIWNYIGYVTSGADTTSKTILKNEITEKTTINSKDAFKQVGYVTVYTYLPIVDTSYDTSSVYLAETDDAILSYDSLTAVPDTALKLPLKKDKTWTQVYSGVTVTYTVLLQEDVTVPAKTYKKAWKVEMSYSVGGTTYTMYYWYADGVGMIKNSYTSGTYKSWMELESSTIK